MGYCMKENARQAVDYKFNDNNSRKMAGCLRTTPTAAVYMVASPSKPLNLKSCCFVKSDGCGTDLLLYSLLGPLPISCSGHWYPAASANLYP